MPDLAERTVNVSENGVTGTAATATATLAITQSTTTTGGYHVTYAAIPVGASQSFGFQGTWSANDASPADFTVNGAACT